MVRRKKLASGKMGGLQKARNERWGEKCYNSSGSGEAVMVYESRILYDGFASIVQMIFRDFAWKAR